MKYLNDFGPMLLFVILFLVLPISSIPGLFDVVLVVLGIITLAVLVCIGMTLATRRKA